MTPADTGARAATRVLAIYNLSGRLRCEPALMHSLGDWLDLGRFAHHVATAGDLLPRVTDPVEIDPARFRFLNHQPRVRVRRIAAAIATTPRRDGLLFLDLTLGTNERAEDVADFLYATWHQRPAMRVDGTPLLEWLATPLSHVGTEGGKPLSFGQNVHQCVFAGGRFARRLLRHNRNPDRVSPDVITVVFRGTIAANRGSRLDIRRPAALNNPGETLVAHGRGVSLITGWTEPVENAFGIAAAGLVNAAGVVSRVRRQSLEALTVNDESTATKAAAVRDLITDLTERLNQLRLDLSFGIEAYADMTLIPELLIESYHASLRKCRLAAGEPGEHVAHRRPRGGGHRVAARHAGGFGPGLHRAARQGTRRPGGGLLAVRAAADVAARLLRHQLHERGRALLDLRLAPLRRRVPGRLVPVHRARHRGARAAVADPAAHAGLGRPGAARPALTMTT